MTAVSTSDLVSIDVTGSATGVLLTVSGEVDSSTAPRLREVVESAFADRVPALTVDLDRVTFLDSAGLCVLAFAHRRAAEVGVRLRVVASSRAVIRPLQITGLYDLLAVEHVGPGTGAA
ncbi:STAS domain-containing protein [Geodermatophilus obscurus]|uniref:Anti-sigma factor antagonist n=1 Tax=Geodermatophilus obscurus TaxID=1861 RepID=A0A1M7TDI0_9ACTN|nr:STAS domain-containing protein [Geodermatophilus obscurus]SHN68834.1 STAS domain-containing protein [Geodermatophilus obscurus]